MTTPTALQPPGTKAPLANRLALVTGGIIPAADVQALRSQGVAAVFTPRDVGITAIIARIVDEIRRAHNLRPWQSWPGTLAGATRQPLGRATVGPATAATIKG